MIAARSTWGLGPSKAAAEAYRESPSLATPGTTRCKALCFSHALCKTVILVLKLGMLFGLYRKSERISCLPVFNASDMHGSSQHDPVVVVGPEPLAGSDRRPSPQRAGAVVAAPATDSGGRATTELVRWDAPVGCAAASGCLGSREPDLCVVDSAGARDTAAVAGNGNDAGPEPRAGSDRCPSRQRACTVVAALATDCGGELVRWDAPGCWGGRGGHLSGPSEGRQ